MTEVYRKHGRVAHYEHGHLVIVSEAGEAVEEGQHFSVSPLREDVELPPIDGAEVERIAHRIEQMIEPPLYLERLIVSHGIAAHEFGGTSWQDETRRIHAAIASPLGERALVDRGDFEVDEIARAAAALARAVEERDAPVRLRLAPAVTAALIPMLEGVAPPNVELWQSPGGFDGKGQTVHAWHVNAPPWPNWYRPSYRVRPLRLPLNVHLRCDIDTIDPDVPIAVAILAPVSGLVMRVLVDDGRRVHPATVRISRIDAVGRETVWYPYGAGTFGAEVML